MKHTFRTLIAALWLSGCGQDIPEAPAPVSAPPPLPSPVAKAANAPGDNAAPAATGDNTAPAAPGLAFAGFEGDIGLSFQKEGEPKTDVTVSVKGTKFRFGVPQGLERSRQFGKQVHVIVDASTKKLLAVIEDKQQVISLDLDRIGEQFKSFAPPGPDAKRERGKAPEIKKTGHTDTVAGRSCEDWEVTTEDREKVRICVANEGAGWFSLPTLGLPAEHAWARELMDGQHMPLRAIMLDESGKEAGRLEVTKLDKKAVSDALFEPPAGYKVTDVATMMSAFLDAAKAMGKPDDKPGAESTEPKKLPPNIREMVEKMRLRAEQRKAKQKPKD